MYGPIKDAVPGRKSATVSRTPKSKTRTNIFNQTESSLCVSACLFVFLFFFCELSFLITKHPETCVVFIHPKNKCTLLFPHPRNWFFQSAKARVLTRQKKVNFHKLVKTEFLERLCVKCQNQKRSKNTKCFPRNIQTGGKMATRAVIRSFCFGKR